MARAQGARIPKQLAKRGRPQGAVRHLRSRSIEPSAVQVDADTLARWRRSPLCFIREALRHPDTLEPIQLFPLQAAWLTAGFTPDANGKLPAAEVLLLAPKKSGKSFLNALAVLFTVVVLGGRKAEGYVLANDLHQAASRVFQAICELTAASPVLRDHVQMTGTKLYFPATGSFIEALAADAAGAAGANPTCISFDEIWGIEHARAKRLWAEMCTVPSRHVSVRVCSSYPGFVGQSPILEDLHRRGVKGEEIAPGIFRSKGLVMAWYRDVAVAPWQDEAWKASMREQLGEAEYRRMVVCDFVSSSSIFISADDWAAVEDANLRPIISARAMPVWVGVDASLKHDATAIAVCTWDAALQKVRLLDLRIFEPSPDSPLDFEGAVEKTLLELRDRFTVRSVRFDPYQLAYCAQRLTAAGLPMLEWAQTEKNLTDGTTSLYTLIKGRNFVTYPDERLRKAVSQAVVKQTGRGWKVSKEKRAHKVDAVVALAFACLGAEKEGPVTGDGADYVASANLGPWRGPSISVGGLTGERPDYDTDDAAYLRDSRLEQAPWRQATILREVGVDGSPDDASIPYERAYGSRRWREEF